jgi:hypothetical protein
MRSVRTRYLMLLLAVVGFVCFSLLRSPSPTRNLRWLQVSVPVLEPLTNANKVTSAVHFSVSNTGPRAVVFVVRWLEVRSKAQLTLLATNQFAFTPIQLPAGRSTNLIMLAQSLLPQNEPSLCGCQIYWEQSFPGWMQNKISQHLSDWLNKVSRGSALPWARPLVQDTVSIANTPVADYFQAVYGWTRKQWLEDIARVYSEPAPSTNFRWAYGPLSGRASVVATTEELARLQARDAFIKFCQSGRMERQTMSP